MSYTTQKQRNIGKMVLTTLVIFALVMIAILVSGCSTPAASTPDPEASSAAAPEEEPAPEPEDDGIYTFGETVTFQDNLSISVSEPAAYTPSDTSAGSVEGQSAVVFEIVLTNGTEEAIEPMVFNTASSGGESASMISDVENNVGLPPMTAILPGQTIKWKEAYSVVDAASITFDVSAGFSYDNVIFTNVQ